MTIDQIEKFAESHTNLPWGDSHIKTLLSRIHELEKGIRNAIKNHKRKRGYNQLTCIVSEEDEHLYDAVDNLLLPKKSIQF